MPITKGRTKYRRPQKVDKGWRLQKEKNWMDASYQLPVTSHQEDRYQTDEQRYEKKERRGIPV